MVVAVRADVVVVVIVVEIWEEIWAVVATSATRTETGEIAAVAVTIGVIAILEADMAVETTVGAIMDLGITIGEITAATLAAVAVTATGATMVAMNLATTSRAIAADHNVVATLATTECNPIREATLATKQVSKNHPVLHLIFKK